MIDQGRKILSTAPIPKMEVFIPDNISDIEDDMPLVAALLEQDDTDPFVDGVITGLCYLYNEYYNINEAYVSWLGGINYDHYHAAMNAGPEDLTILTEMLPPFNEEQLRGPVAGGIVSAYMMMGLRILELELSAEEEAAEHTPPIEDPDTMHEEIGQIARSHDTIYKKKSRMNTKIASVLRKDPETTTPEPTPHPYSTLATLMETMDDVRLELLEDAIVVSVRFPNAVVDDATLASVRNALNNKITDALPDSFRIYAAGGEMWGCVQVPALLK